MTYLCIKANERGQPIAEGYGITLYCFASWILRWTWRREWPSRTAASPPPPPGASSAVPRPSSVLSGCSREASVSVPPPDYCRLLCEMVRWPGSWCQRRYCCSVNKHETIRCHVTIAVDIGHWNYFIIWALILIILASGNERSKIERSK